MSDDRDGVPVSVAWILVAAFGAAILVTNWMRMPATKDGAFPTTANDLPVVTVSDAMEVQGLHASSDVAVSGWFQQAPPLPCPAQRAPVPLLIRNCNIEITWLMEEPESIVRVGRNGADVGSPSGPAIHPLFDGPVGAWARQLPVAGDSTPTPVVFIGHFDDERAADCPPEDLQRCLDRFVVTVVTWADSVDNP